MNPKNTPIVIAIDGFAATGKSTLAKLLANDLNYVYVDTGAMYRAVTYFALQNGWLSDGVVASDQLIQNLNKIHIRFVLISDEQHTFLNDKDVEKQIRAADVSDYVSDVAAIPEVRTFLVAQQQGMGKEKGIVMDGRDIGTVVFPDAECKFFLSASPEIRAQRRLLELQSMGVETTMKKVLENVKKRDQVDSQRTVSPLKKADDAHFIEVSEMTVAAVFEQLKMNIEAFFTKNQSE